MLPTFTTPRLSLAALAVEDHAFIQELVNTEGWLRFIGDRNVHSREEAVGYINRINGSPDVQYWVVRLHEAQVPVGVVTLIQRAHLEHADLGFAFLPQFNGAGYAYEAAREVLTSVRSQSAHATVLAISVPDNTRSIHLLTKLGFRFDRELDVENEKVHVYSTGERTQKLF